MLSAGDTLRDVRSTVNGKCIRNSHLQQQERSLSTLMHCQCSVFQISTDPLSRAAATTVPSAVAASAVIAVGDHSTMRARCKAIICSLSEVSGCLRLPPRPGMVRRDPYRLNLRAQLAGRVLCSADAHLLCGRRAQKKEQGRRLCFDRAQTLKL